VNRLGIEVLSTFGLPPVEHVQLAADLGCANISLLLRPFDVTKLARPLDVDPHGYPPFDLVSDTALRRRTAALLSDLDIEISLAEGLSVRPGLFARDRADEFDAFAAMGAQRINLVSLDADRSRTLDEFAVTYAMAAERGMQAVVEFTPGMTINCLAAALEVIDHIGPPGPRLLIDTMHLIRSGCRPGDLAALDPDLIGYVQISDTPLVSTASSYVEEAMLERCPPGHGELPLLEILRCVPAETVIGIEVPQIRLARAGVGPHDRLRPAVAGTQALLARLANP
jgi:sugar phosphate isomerase/epimerase